MWLFHSPCLLATPLSTFHFPVSYPPTCLTLSNSSLFCFYLSFTVPSPLRHTLQKSGIMTAHYCSAKNIQLCCFLNENITGSNSNYFRGDKYCAINTTKLLFLKYIFPSSFYPLKAFVWGPLVCSKLNIISNIFPMEKRVFAMFC